MTHLRPSCVFEGATANIFAPFAQIGGQEHFYLETNASLVVPGEAGSMEIFASTQNPTKTQDFCASVCGLDKNKVILVCFVVDFAVAVLFVVVVVVVTPCRVHCDRSKKIRAICVHPFTHSDIILPETEAED